MLFFMNQNPVSRFFGLSPAGLAFVVLAHGLLLWVLLHMNVIPLAEPLKVLNVQILQPDPPKVETPPESPRELPKLPPMRKQPVPQAAPVPLSIPEDAAVAAPAVEARPAVPLPPIEAMPTAVSEPRFDADYLDNPRPVYPALSRRMGEQGRVILRVHVTAAGRADEVQVKTSSGFERLDQAALSAVRQWRFMPAKHGDEAVAAWVLVPLSFNIKES